MLNIKKWLAFSAAAAVFATACATAATDDAADIASTEEAASTVPTEGSTTSEATDDQPEAAQGVLPAGPSALDDMRADEFPAALIDIDEIISGGPPPDGIPPIEDPVFLPVIDNIDILDPDESVVALEIDGDARAYPVRAMIWHEIVNDTVGGVPVTVTYCPLCNSATTYKRVIRGGGNHLRDLGQVVRLFARDVRPSDRVAVDPFRRSGGRRCARRRATRVDPGATDVVGRLP